MKQPTTRWRLWMTTILALSLIATACAEDNEATETTIDTATTESPATTTAMEEEPSTTASDVETTTTVTEAMELRPLKSQISCVFANEPLAIGVEMGFFEDYGLDIEFVSYSPGTQVPLVLNGESAIGSTGLGQVATAAEAGLGMKVVAGKSREQSEEFNGSTASVVAAEGSGIEGFADLEGKTVSANALNDFSQSAVIQKVIAAGADPSTIDWVQIPFTGTAEALAQGRVDAALTVEPFRSAALDTGAYIVGLAVPQNSSTGVFFANQIWIQENPDLLQAFLDGLDATYQYVNENQEELKEHHSERCDVPLESALSLPDLTWNIEMDRTALEESLEAMIAAGILEQEVTVEDFVYAGVLGS